MSWEGYIIGVCENGCLTTVGPYEHTEECCACGAPIVREWICDQTNSTDDERLQNNRNHDDAEQFRLDYVREHPQARAHQITRIEQQKQKYLDSVSAAEIVKTVARFDAQIKELVGPDERV